MTIYYEHKSQSCKKNDFEQSNLNLNLIYIDNIIALSETWQQLYLKEYQEYL